MRYMKSVLFIIIKMKTKQQEEKNVQDIQAEMKGLLWPRLGSPRMSLWLSINKASPEGDKIRSHISEKEL